MINRPTHKDYPPYAANYVNMVPDCDVTGMLEQLKDSTFNLLNNLDDGQGNFTYGAGKWTVKEVIGHMIDTERTFAYRLLYFSRDNGELPGFDQDTYVKNSNYSSRSVQDLASEFRVTRQSNLYLVNNLSQEQLLQTGVASGYSISVAALVYIMAGHELYHLKLLKEKYFI